PPAPSINRGGADGGARPRAAHLHRRAARSGAGGDVPGARGAPAGRRPVGAPRGGAGLGRGARLGPAARRLRLGGGRGGIGAQSMKSALSHELSCRYLQPILDLCDPAPLCGEWGVTVEQLRDQTNWVSLRFCEALVDLAAAQVGADPLTEKVTRAALSPKAMGFLYPLLRAFGSPQLGFPALPRLVGQLNKVSIVEVRAVRRGSCEIEYRPSSAE